jgi:hypothetical protein
LATSWIIFTFSLIIIFLLFNSMAIHYFKITSIKLWHLKRTQREQTLTLPSDTRTN